MKTCFGKKTETKNITNEAQKLKLSRHAEEGKRGGNSSVPADDKANQKQVSLPAGGVTEGVLSGNTEKLPATSVCSLTPMRVCVCGVFFV